ncbi:microsomal delta-12 fatty acid desaturase [Haematococcus lacustris]|uniref:Delta 12 fatty acid desaturase n=1 Tax=Haematococcus sp. LZ-2019 TaxID=2569585 RepID=A0A6G5QC57_9CHLO|nr:delta 12 fatty acid desaturase [Haematococcus sp. LZ-2019]QCB64664.1 delta 12 fatty acid desaturase [Haematococcus sp. LZ-2019]
MCLATQISADQVDLRKPATQPPFTLADIRRAIPAHCFQRSLLKSVSYLAVDVLLVALLFTAACYIDHLGPAKWLLWPAYWFLQGAVSTGIWVIAHECGHGAFSDTAWINDGVGLVFHSLLLVPYFSWKHSHRRHHQNTGSVDKDEVFVPIVLPVGSDFHWLMKTPVYRALHIAFMSLLGWPSYLFFNAAGRHYDRWANHFDPFSPIFSKKERVEVLYSDIALGLVLTGLGLLWKTFGFMWLLKMYIIPYLVVNHWLVMITFLQHTHPSLPHYDDKEWDWLRGALATVDRSYGVLDHVFHHIADTHVCHHLFSYMPHYHAQEATEAMKKVLGPYYAQDKRNVFQALWQDLAACPFVTVDAPGEATYWFQQGTAGKAKQS